MEESKINKEHQINDQTTGNTEWDRLWDIVSKDPNDFKSWEELIAVTENCEGGVSKNTKPEDVEKIRRVYNNFLYKFPLCFGYWKKYSDLELLIEGVPKAEEIFEKGLSSIHNSIDLWNQYCDFKIKYTRDNEQIRSVFERAAESVGYDFQSHQFWDKYIEWEETNHEEAKAFAILERVIKIPIQAYTHMFEKYSSLSLTRPISELVSKEQLSEIEEKVNKSLEGKEGGNKDSLIRQEIHSIKSEQYMKVQSEVQKRWAFELEIKRPYFHVKPLDEFQLKNWRKYLDFEESQGDEFRIYTLYERCLVSCALYEEFWERYAKYLISQGKIDSADDIYMKAINVFIPANRPAIRLSYALFQEQQGKIKEARELYQQTLATVSGHLETINYFYNFERRQKNLEEAEKLLKSSLDSATEENSKIFLTVKLATFYQKNMKNIENARKLLKESLEKFISSKYFLYNYITLETSQDDIEEVQENCKEIFKQIKSEQCTLPLSEKIILGKIYLEFLLEQGTSINLYNEIDTDLKKMIETEKNSTTIPVNESRKRKLVEPSIYEPQPNKRSMIPAVASPVVSIPPQTQAAYPSNPYYSDLSVATATTTAAVTASSYPYNPQSTAYQQGYYMQNGWDYSQQQVYQ